MSEILQFEKRSETLGRKLPTPLREFLDAVIIPALIDKAKEHFSQVETSKSVAPSNCVMAESPASGSI